MSQHRFRPVSNAQPDRLRRCGPEAFGDERGVRRVDEIGRSVGDRPIEVENDRGTVNGFPPFCPIRTPALICAASAT